MTYENLSNYRRAREHLELFLLAEPNARYADKIKKKVEKLKNLEEKLQSMVVVTSSPPDATVYIDGEVDRPAGKTPVELPVGPGQHTLILEKEGHRKLESTFEVAEGETLEKNFQLRAESSPERTDEVADQTDGDGSTDGETVSDTSAPPSGGNPMTRVDIAPPAGIAVLGWTAMITGIAAIGVSFGYPGTTLQLLTLGVGAGLLALGGYLMWGQDHASHLPPPGGTNEQQSSLRHESDTPLGTPDANAPVGFGFRLKF